VSTPFKILSLKNKKKDKKNFSNELGDNFRQWGFAGIKDHSVDPSLVTEVVSLFADFFKLPRKVKESYYKAELGGSRGYTPIKIETPKGGKNPDIKEFWHIGRNLDSNDPYRKWMHDNFFINEIPELSEKANLLFCQFDELGKSLLESVALYLDLEEKYFTNAVNKGNSVMRAIHYPPLKDNEIGERAGAHEDINLITLLIGGHKSGLEILSKAGEWQDATVDEGIIICNIGDMLQRLTNNYLISTTHRVSASSLQSESSRYSIPFFVHPNPDWLIATLPSCCDEDRPNLYTESILAEDYLKERLKEIKLI
tara:strand:+ start:21228 stop:22160 length:933 start_codon:yes stop_codon:yes gene_type:complete